MRFFRDKKLSQDLVLLGVGLCMLWPARALASLHVDLNGDWQFRTDPEKQGEARDWMRQLPEGTETVRVPHTWNIGKYDDFEGTAWYFRSFEVPEELGTKHVEIHFGATFYKSRVWLNGSEIGGHEGGHTEYFFDVTAHLKSLNFLAVEINNQPTTQTIPGWAMKLVSDRNLWYDWWHYGGVVRDVWLNMTGDAFIRRQQIRPQVEGTSANVSDTVFLENHATKPLPLKLLLKTWPPDGGPARAAAEQSLTLPPGSHSKALALRIDSVKLWDFDHPNVYRAEVILEDARGNPLDSLTDNFGARSVEIRDRHLLLNGEPVRLTGMARHEESPGEGLAETRGTMKYDWDDMKNLQMTLTRPVHYPQHPYILDYADRNGILVIPEIPMWQFSGEQMSDPKVIALAQQMMREMVEQDFNHPSVFAWSVCNESATDTPGGRSYFKTMYDFLKSLDPDRYVTYADDRIAFVDNPGENSAGLADFIMWNEYFGAWHGPTSLLPAVFERIKHNYPNKMVIVSEFGTPGVFASDSVAADKLRVEVFRDQLEQIGKQDWIAGALMWCYQDYKSHRNLWPGLTKGIVDHGVVDENRQRRPSYQVWQSLNSPAHVQMKWNFNPESRPAGFTVTISRRGPDEIPSYALRGYRVSWELRDRDNNRLAGGEKDLPDIGAPQTLDARWPVLTSPSLHLTFRLFRPTGFVAGEHTLDWWAPRSGGFSIEDMKREGKSVPE